MTARLSFGELDRTGPNVARPRFDPRALRTGIVHLGLGNFHRAHQAVFTEDAIVKYGGDWGIAGISLKRPDTPRALAAQDHLYTLETLSEERRYRILGVVRESLAAGQDDAKILAALASASTHVVTLTVTEKGYCLDGAGALDFGREDIVHDVAHPVAPRTAIGWLVRGLSARRASHAGKLSVIACDNLADNGGKLERAVLALARANDTSLADWIGEHAMFPCTMVDSIVPATDAACRARVEAVLGVIDAAPVMREAFAQWVIENRFAGPRPAWEAAGAEIVGNVEPFEKLKLHVLNAAHSALAYLGLPRGYRFVREAIADAALSRFLDSLMEVEVTPALAPLGVGPYWRTVRARFSNPSLDHRLDQIAEDGSVKLAQRVFPLLIANFRAGRPYVRLAAIVCAWLEFARAGDVRDPARDCLAAWSARGGRLEDALDEPSLFPDAFRTDTAVRRAMLESEQTNYPDLS